MGKKFALGIVMVLAVLIMPLVACAESQPAVIEPVMSQRDIDIINDLIEYLKRQGVPLISVETIGDYAWYPPVAIELVIQSSKEGDEAVQDNAIFSNLVSRAANLAHRRGLNIGAISTIFVNAQGEKIATSTEAIKAIEAIESLFDPPQELDDDTAAMLLRQNLSLHGMTLEKLDVSLDSDGYRWATFYLRVPDMDTANAVFPSFLSDVRVTIRDLNAGQGTKITICGINISDSNDELLLKYVRDLQMGHQSWWQAEGFTMEWFPHPPPPPEE